VQIVPSGVNPNSGSSDAGDTVQAVTTAVTHVAVALDELREQLEIANRRVGEMAAAKITEDELGRLFVRAAQFADSAIADAHEEARRVLNDARDQAERIMADARGRADAIIEEAQQSNALPPAVAAQLHATIDGFTHVNAELIKEMEFLRDALQPQLGSWTAPSLPHTTPGENSLLTMPSFPATPPSPWAPTVSDPFDAGNVEQSGPVAPQ
jgi:cell division septum initiation protein DivIVA